MVTFILIVTQMEFWLLPFFRLLIAPEPWLIAG